MGDFAHAVEPQGRTAWATRLRALRQCPGTEHEARCPPYALRHLTQAYGTATSTRLIAPADGGLALAETWKLPHAGAARIAIGADVRIDQIGPPRRDAGAHGIAEVGGTVDAYALD